MDFFKKKLKIYCILFEANLGYTEKSMARSSQNNNKKQMEPVRSKTDRSQ